MTDTMQQDPTPYPIPDGAEALGVAGLYEAYNATRAAKIEDPSEDNARAFSKAQANLSNAFAYWRGIREWAYEVAIAEWAAANPEAAAAVAAKAAQQDEEA